MNLWAVIPSRDRLESLLSLTWQLTNDDVNVVIVDNGYGQELHDQFAALYATAEHDRVPYAIRAEMDPPNISKLWNAGINWVEELQAALGGPYVVAVLNDDIVVPGGFVKTLADAIVANDAAGAYPDQHGMVKKHANDGDMIVFKDEGPVDMRLRMCGYAFAMRGPGLLADENLAWWYGDDDLDWRLRSVGGNVLVGGLKVDHLSPNSTTVGVLAEQTGRDRETFINKWGRAPW